MSRPISTYLRAELGAAELVEIITAQRKDEKTGKVG
jgi:hypothetical protein